MLDSDQLNGFELSAIKGSAKQQITVNSALKVADGGDITLLTPRAAINANLTAHAGSINAGNIFLQPDRERDMTVGDVYLRPSNGTPAWSRWLTGSNSTQPGAGTTWRRTLRTTLARPGSMAARCHCAPPATWNWRKAV
jgi:hypothetical protein